MLVGVIVIVADSGSGGTATTPPPATTTPPPSSPPSTASPTTSPPASYQLGQMVDIGNGAYIKVESLQKQQGIACITVLIDNSGGSEDIAVSSLLSFGLKDSSGNQAEIDIFADCQHYPPDGTVLVGDKLRGSLGYDILSLTGSIALYYKYDLLENPIKIELE